MELIAFAMEHLVDPIIEGFLRLVGLVWGFIFSQKKDAPSKPNDSDPQLSFPGKEIAGGHKPAEIGQTTTSVGAPITTSSLPADSESGGHLVKPEESDANKQQQAIQSPQFQARDATIRKRKDRVDGFELAASVLEAQSVPDDLEKRKRARRISALRDAKPIIHSEPHDSNPEELEQDTKTLGYAKLGLLDAIAIVKLQEANEQKLAMLMKAMEELENKIKALNLQKKKNKGQRLAFA